MCRGNPIVTIRAFLSKHRISDLRFFNGLLESESHAVQENFLQELNRAATFNDQ
jgi:hypothetical protein